MKVGVLTGGGDCPGLNAVIRAIIRKGITYYNYEILGFQRGWLGVMEGKYEYLNLDKSSGILTRGGTILGTSRTNPYKKDKGEEKIKQVVKELKLGAIIAIGGEDTLGVAHKLHQSGIPTVGVPKTIDNDLGATDYTFGFDTAVQIATEAIDRLHTTAESHHRIMVVEVMGRHAGWIATHSGVAGGADVILVPEFPFKIQEVCDYVRRRHNRGKVFSIVVIAEGAKMAEEGEIKLTEELDSFGHVRLGGIGETLGKELEKRLGYETRVTTLGHVQRGGTPTAYDRFLATRFGLAAIDMVKQGKFGQMAALRGTEIVSVPLEEAVKELKIVTQDIYDEAKVFFG